MKNLVTVLGLAIVVAAGMGPQAPQSKDWKALFNGKDLSGWRDNGEETWAVDHGMILCESKANKYGYLSTEKNYKDFDLKLKFKSEAEGNSGVFFHSRLTGNDPKYGPAIEGLQAEVDPSLGKHTGGLYETSGREWVALPTADGEKVLKQGQWNDLEVSVHGNHIVTLLNGVQIVDFTDPAPKFTDGVIALQIHTGGGVKMRWKDIYIAEK